MISDLLQRGQSQLWVSSYLKMTRIVAVRSLLVKGKNFQFNKESTDKRGSFSVNDLRVDMVEPLR